MKWSVTLSVFLGLLVFCTVMVFYYEQFGASMFASKPPPPPSPAKRAQSLNVTPSTGERIPVILFWTGFFSKRDWYFGVGTGAKGLNCKYKCDYISDKSRFNESAAVVIHPRNRVAPLPTTDRQSWQLFVFYLMESPVHTPPLGRYANVFNMTITYRLDSDIPGVYGVFSKEKTDMALEPFTLQNNSFESRTKWVIWVVSNCDPPSKRQHYARHLQKYIPVDVYGKCGKGRVPFTDEVEKDYKFLFSAENSLCEDYITKKTHVGLRVGAIPIVYGGANYSLQLPPNSYIDIADFSSPKHLATYLRKVAGNSTLYSSYFEWRRTYVSLSSTWNTMCTLCEKLHHNESLPAKVYSDIQSWWSKGKCWAPEKKYPHLAKYFH